MFRVLLQNKLVQLAEDAQRLRETTQQEQEGVRESPFLMPEE